MSDYNVKINVDAQAAQRAIEGMAKGTQAAKDRLEEFGNALVKNVGYSTKNAEAIQKMKDATTGLAGQYKIFNQAAKSSVKDINAQVKAASEYEKTLTKLSSKYSPLISQQQKLSKLFNELAILKKEGVITTNQLVSIYDREKNAINGTTAALEKKNKAAAKERANVEALRKQYDPLFAAQRKYEQSTQNLIKLRNKEAISVREFNLLMEQEKTILNSTLSVKERLAKSIQSEQQSLSNLKATYDSSYAAKQKFNKSTADLNTLLSKGKISIDFYNKSFKEQQKILNETINGKRKLNDAHVKERNSLNELRMKYDTLYAAQERQKRAQNDLSKLLERGVIKRKEYNRLLAESRKRLADESGQTDKNIASIKRLSHAIKEVGIATTAWNGYVSALRVAWKVFFGLTVAKTLGMWAIGFAKAGESVELLGKKLTYLTGDAESLGKVSESAHRVGIDFQTLNKTLTRFAVTTKNQFSVNEMIGWTEALVKSGRAVGTTNQELQSGLLQLSQAMSAGRLMGDEFRSISENLPLLKIELQKIFEQMGMGDIALKQLSRDGKITSDILIKAFNALGVTVKDFPGALGTIDANLAKIRKEVNLFIGAMTKDGSIVANAFQSIADSLRFVRQEIFGIIPGEKKLNAEFKETVKVTESASQSIENVSKTASTLSTVASNLFNAMFGVNEAFANTPNNANSANSSLSIVAQTLGLIASIAVGKGIWNLIKWVSKIGGVTGTLSLFAVALKKTYGFAVMLIPKLGALATGFKALTIAVGLSTGGIGLIAAAIVGAGFAIGNYIADMFKAEEASKNAGVQFGLTKDKVNELSEAFEKLGAASALENLEASSQESLRASEVYDSLQQEVNSLYNEFKDGKVGIDEYNDRLSMLQQFLAAAQNQIVGVNQILGETGKSFVSAAGDIDKVNESLSDLIDSTLKGTAPKELSKYVAELDKIDQIRANMIASAGGSLSNSQEEQLGKAVDALKIKYENLFKIKEKSTVKETKDLNKLTQARRDYNSLLKAGIGGAQLEEARSKLEKYNGVAEELVKNKEALAKAAEQEKKAESELNKLNEEKMALFSKFNPELSTYLDNTKDLTKALELGVISEAKFNELLEEQQALLKKNSGQLTEYEQAMLGWNSGLKTFSDEAQDYYSQMEEISQKTMNSMTDHLTDFVTTGKMDFEGFVDSIVEDITRMAIQGSITGPLSEMLQIGGGKSSGSSGGFLSNIFGGGEKESTGEISGGFSVGSSMDALSGIMPGGKSGGCNPCDIAGETIGTSFASMFDDVGEGFDTTFEEMDSGFGNIFDEASNGFGSVIDDIGGGFSSVLSGIGGMFSGGSSSGGGGILDTAMSFIGGFFAKGGAFNDGIQAFANGGIVNSPTVFPMADGAGLMGEAGPEAIMPLTRKNGKLGIEASGGGANITININVSGTEGNPESIRRSAGQVAQAAGNATQRAMRRNG